ncbi:MAG: carbamoyltransferase HypF [Wenzhouxiangellaceae bacterium]|nr:carbamoyltransferase HypF [Wenzhouxiangellaceae bacterium]
MPDLNSRHITIAGRVQGVGFRPFVYRLAHELRLTGWVLNAAGVVEVEVHGPEARLAEFARRVIADAPPLARPELLNDDPVDVPPTERFEIRHSEDAGEPDIHVPPDQFLCADCIAEMSDPEERRYRYPFINCTQCGPRYTIIRALPYDRPNTTLAGFPLCPDCDAEYTNPLDRRFHAQPLACPVCGPCLSFRQGDRVVDGNEAALAETLKVIRGGGVVAIRGVGGYHLVCLADNEPAVAALRLRKHRPDKPLAVMVPMAGDDGLDGARALALLTPAIADRLSDPERPIVLAPMRADARLALNIAPGLREVGLMLPYAPLHHLLLGELRRPIVATSGNLSGEPVLTDPAEADARLAGVADAFLHHNRPIQRPADDPVWRAVAGRVRPIRLGRGNAPLELELPMALDRPLLAVGAFLKNCVALAWKRRVVISPHIGELDSPRAVAVFEQVVEDLQALYGVRAERLACDAHPDFPNSRWARDAGLPLARVYHHEAHASALAGEFGLLDHDLLVFAWDGVGYGRDGQAWGGEVLHGRPGAWQRVAALKDFRLPGGDQVIHQPWRTAQSIAWQAGFDWADAPPVDPLLRHAWESGLASPWTSAAGRLFDAAAVLAGLGHTSSFEGQGPARLEALARQGSMCEPPRVGLKADAQDLLRLDWQELMRWMADGARPAAERALGFHQALAVAIAETAQVLRAQHEFIAVGLTGGVFQNALLAERAVDALQDAGFEVRIPERLPVNDAGIAYGQVIEAHATGRPAGES